MSSQLTACSLAPALHTRPPERRGVVLLRGRNMSILAALLVAGGNRHWNFAKLILAENPVAYGRSGCLFSGQSAEICESASLEVVESVQSRVFPRDYTRIVRICAGRRAGKRKNRRKKCTIQCRRRTLPLHGFAVLGSRRSDGSPRVYVEYWFFK